MKTKRWPSRGSKAMAVRTMPPADVPMPGRAGEVGRQRAPPGLAARFAVAVGLGRRRRAPGGAAPARGGRRRAAAGRDAAPSDRARRRSPRPPAPPRAANRAAGGSRSANRPGSGSTSPSAGTTARCASAAAAVVLALRDRQHEADGALETLLEHPRQALALHRVLHLGGVDRDVARQAPLAPQVVPGVLEGAEQVAGIELQALRRRPAQSDAPSRAWRPSAWPPAR